MTSEWIATYDQNEIKITNKWLSGEKLFVNNELQDQKVSLMTATLTGSVRNSSGEKLPIKANLSGFFSVNCHLFIDDKKVEVKQIK